MDSEQVVRGSDTRMVGKYCLKKASDITINLFHINPAINLSKV
jgi:hypothetical protein